MARSKKISILEGLPRNDKFAKGYVELYKIQKDTNSRLLLAKSNLIVYKGREWILPRLLNVENTNITPANHQNFAIYWISFGQGGAPSGDPLNPTPPQDTDEALADEIVIGTNTNIYADNGRKHPIDAVSYLQDSANDNRYVIAQVQCTLDETEANGSGSQDINEAALWVANSNEPDAGVNPATDFSMFARVTFPTQRKDANLVLQILWYIYC